MLRNGIKISEKILVLNHCHEVPRKLLATNTQLKAKNISNQQGKIFNKLFGERLTGSKRKWYPVEGTMVSNKTSNLFKASQFGKPGAGSTKNNATRRMTVLNKVFMSHITDLLATGEVSEVVLGHGLQVTRVKISPDFSCINVYWLGCGDPLADAQLEQNLQKSAGLLRHELSQLKLVGEVPRVRFAREKTYSNQAQVEALLANMEITEDGHDQTADNVNHQRDTAYRLMKEEFYGKFKKEGEIEQITELDKVQEIRHDVLGLDHSDIMLKILTKMRRSKQAWEAHNQETVTSSLGLINEPNTTSSNANLDKVSLKEAKVAKEADSFNKFLEKRKERKVVPDRKKYDARDEYIGESNSKNLAAEHFILGESRRQLYEEEDYIHEELEDNGNSAKNK